LQSAEPFLQTLDLSCRDVRLLPVGSVEGRQVASDRGIRLLDPSLDGAGCVVLVAGVHCLELAAVDRDERFREQAELAAQQDKLAAGGPDGRAVVTTEVGDCLEVGSQPTREPNQFEIALSLALEPPTGRNTVQVAVDIELQQHRRVIAGTPCLCRDCPRKTEFGQVQFVDECLDQPDCVVFIHVVVDAFRKQEALTPVQTLNVARHHLTPNRTRSAYQSATFSHTLHPIQPFAAAAMNDCSGETVPLV
jgi:hypothetical protein